MDEKAESDRKPLSDRQGSTAFAIRLKQLRVLRGYRTARAFAQALQIDENRYTRWERGEVEPSDAMLAKMAEVLNLPVDILVSGGDVAAGLPSPMVTRESGPRVATSHGRFEQPGLQEEASRFTLERTPEELSQKVLIASRTYLMSLLERRVAGMSQHEIDAFIAKLTAAPDSNVIGLEAKDLAGRSGGK